MLGRPQAGAVTRSRAMDIVLEVSYKPVSGRCKGGAGR